MRIATWNIKHAEQRGLDAITSVLRDSGAELIALQEVDRNCARSGNVDQARVLGEALGLSHAFASSMPWEGGDYGNALLVDPKLIGGRPLIAKALALPGGSGPGEEPRCLLAARAGGFRVFVTHLDLPATTRIAQADALLELIGSARGALLLGDFNEGPRGPAVRKLLTARLRDAWTESLAPEQPTAPHDRPQERIDLVLLGEGVGPARLGRAVRSDASDHPLIVVDLL